jgi:tRNA(fMet)-specific endonuclease VapC
VAAQGYGNFRACLKKQGTPIGSIDMLIASYALSLSCILVTDKNREFGRIPTLTIQNWAK